jgi:hypothetical protein
MKPASALTLDEVERDFQDRQLHHGTVRKWTREKPLATVLIDFDCGEHVSCVVGEI